MNVSSAATLRTVDLGYEQMLILEGRPGTRVHVLFGGVWLTEEGRPEDVFARSGQVIALRARKRALIEGLGPTRIEVVEPARTRPWSALLAGARSAAERAAKAAHGIAARSAGALRGTVAGVGLIVGVAVPTLVLLGLTATPAAVQMLT
jgi:hypothetical protein